MFIYGGGLADSYLKRRELAGSPEVQADDWYRRKLREKAPENPEFRKMLAREAMARIAEGYDKDDVEREWGLRSGLEPAAYDPVADLAADIATWGIYSGTRQAGKMLARGLREPAERALIKPAAKEMGKLFTQEIGLGATAGASIFLAQEIGASPILEMLSGFVGPTAAAGVATLTRKGFATWMRRLKRNNEGLYNRIIVAAQDDADNEFARVVREYELGGPPWRPPPEGSKLAIRDSKTGIIHEAKEGERIHADMLARMEKQGVKYEDIEAGWLTPEGEFSTRWTAKEPGVFRYGDQFARQAEPPKPPGPREKILDLEGPSTIDDALEIMRDEIATAKVVEKQKVKGKFVSITEYPEWFKGKGWTKKQVLHAFEKKQGPIYDELRHVAEGRLEMFGKVMGRDITAGDLKKGDVLTLSTGEQFKVAESEPGNIRLENDETIQTDEFGLIKSVVKLEEGGKPASPQRMEELFRGAELQKAWAKAMGDPNKPIVTTRKIQDFEKTWFDLDLPELPERAVNINLAKFNSREDIKMAVAKMTKLYEPDVQAARRGKISLEQQRRNADKFGMTLEDFLARGKGQAYATEELINAGRFLDSAARQFDELATKAASPMASDIDKMAFLKMKNIFYATIMQYSGAEAEAGRALGALRIAVRGSKERMRAMKELIEQMEAGVPVEKQAAMFAALPTTQAMARTVRQAYKATTWDMFLEAWINGLLSNPTTHGVNTISTGLFSVWQIPERYLASQIGRALPGPQEIQASEATAMAWGMLEGFKDGLKVGWKTFKTAEPMEHLGKAEMRRMPAITAQNLNLDPAGTFGRAVDIMAEFIRSPGARGLMAEDDLFKSSLYRGELKALAWRYATMEGLEGEEFAKAVRNYVDNPPESLSLGAMDMARYATFQAPLEEMGKATQQWIKKVPPLRLVVPFFRTGVNLTKVFHERTPVYPITSLLPVLWGRQSKFWGEIAAGGARRDLALAKVSFGSMFLAVGAELAAQGYITGGGPVDPDARKSLRSMKWQPYSLCTNPGAPMEQRNYIAFNRVDPFGFFLGSIADIVEIMRNIDYMAAEEIAATAVIAFTENVTSKTWIRGLSDLAEAYDDPKRYMKNYIRKMAGTLIPAGVAQIKRITDPTFREVDSWLDQIKSRTPGYSKTLRPKLNRWGEPIATGSIRGEEGHWMWIPLDMMNPFYLSRGRKSPIDEELYRNSIDIGEPRGIIENVKLKPEEKWRYKQLQGQVVKDENTGLNLKQTLDLIVDNPRKAMALGLIHKPYDQMTEGPEGERATEIKRQVEHFRKMARRQLRIEYPELDALIQEMRKKRSGLPLEMMGGIQ